MKIKSIEIQEEDSQATITCITSIHLGIEKEFYLTINYEIYGEGGELHGIETNLEDASIRNSEILIPADSKLFTLLDSYENLRIIEDKLIDELF